MKRNWFFAIISHTLHKTFDEGLPPHALVLRGYAIDSAVMGKCVFSRKWLSAEKFSCVKEFKGNTEMQGYVFVTKWLALTLKSMGESAMLPFLWAIFFCIILYFKFLYLRCKYYKMLVQRWLKLIVVGVKKGPRMPIYWSLKTIFCP